MLMNIQMTVNQKKKTTVAHRNVPNVQSTATSPSPPPLKPIVDCAQEGRIGRDG
jgi:hypothetical protein